MYRFHKCFAICCVLILWLNFFLCLSTYDSYNLVSGKRYDTEKKDLLVKNNFLLITLLISSFVNAMDNPSQKIFPATLHTLQIAGSKVAFYTPDGTHLVVDAKNAAGNNITVRNVQGYEQGINIPIPPYYTLATVSPENTAITVDAQDALSWDIRTGSSVSLPEVKCAERVKYDKCGNRLAFSNIEGINILDVKSNKIIKILENTAQCSFDWDPSNESQIGVCATIDGCRFNTQWSIWDIVAGKTRDLVTIKDLSITSDIQFSNDGYFLVCGASSQFVQCNVNNAALVYYSLNGKKDSHPFKKDGRSLNSACFVPGTGTRLFAGTFDNHVAYCDMEAPENSFVFNPMQNCKTNEICAVAIHPTAGQMAAGSFDDHDKSVMKIFDISAQIKQEDQKAGGTQSEKESCCLV